MEGLVWKKVDTLLELGATHIVLISRSGKVKNYAGWSLQKKPNKVISIFLIILMIYQAIINKSLGWIFKKV